MTTLLLPVKFTFEESFLQEHGKKAVQSYRRAGKLNFGEKRWKKKHALKVDRSDLIQPACFGAGCYIEMALSYHQPYQHELVGG